MEPVWTPPEPRPRRFPWVNAALFLATVGTTLLSGTFPLPPEGFSVGHVLSTGLPFSATIIGILFAHEMGHWLLARAWRVDATLPFFIPGPPLPFGVGTFGAIIRVRSRYPSRRAVLDIGAAGPIAGLVVALPLYAWGLARSEVRAVAGAAARSNTGSLLALLLALARGEPLTSGQGSVQFMGDSLVTWLVGRAVVGKLPAGYDVFLDPVAFAAWLGLLVTTLNLIPIGQLDGGHVGYALLGRRGALALSRVVSWGLFACGLLFSWSWLVWWALTRFVVGMRHPPALVEEPLDGSRRLVALVSFAVFVATFIPVPISV